MKPAEKRRMMQTVRKAVPGLVLHRSYLIATPRGRMLRGLCFEGSSWSPGSYVWWFVQPLYTPLEAVDLSFGARLGSGTYTWTPHEVDRLIELVKSEAVPVLKTIVSPQAFVEWPYIHQYATSARSEALAYSLVACGEFARGAEMLRVVAKDFESDINSDSPEWYHETHMRLVTLAALAETDPPAATALLAEWEAYTVAALKVGDIP